MKDVLAVILAGGKGSRLEPLTRDRAKPAVPFGGAYRIIDFTLSNCLNSGIRRNLVLTQYKAMSLDRHIHLGWQSYLCRELGEFIEVVPPQQRIDEHWYQGTADAVYQNIYTIEKERPKYVVILAGDHIYKMNYAKLVDRHIETSADLTVGTLPVGVQTAAGQFGVLEVDADSRVLGFEEKPIHPKPIPGDPHRALASMGIYVFSARFLFEQLCLDATRHGSTHDFGRDIIPSIMGRIACFSYPFMDENRKKEAYLARRGHAGRLLRRQHGPDFRRSAIEHVRSPWPVRTYQPNLPPPKFVFAERAPSPAAARPWTASSARARSSPAANWSGRSSGPNCRINSYAQVADSILFEGVDVGRHAKIRRAIIDKGFHVPAGIEIGYDRDLDRSRGFMVSEKGITVIAKTHGVHHFGDKSETDAMLPV